jgi:hypothetical protein
MVYFNSSSPEQISDWQFKEQIAEWQFKEQIYMVIAIFLDILDIYKYLEVISDKL